MRPITKFLFSLFILQLLAILPSVSAEGTPDQGSSTCSSGEPGASMAPSEKREGEISTCYEEPYVPTECELQMWDIWSAADKAVNSLLKEPICAELVASWGLITDEPIIGIADQMGPVNESLSGEREAAVTVIKKRKLRKLTRAAARCRARE